MVNIKALHQCAISVIAFERPLISLSDVELQENLEVIQDEIESKGGVESLGRLSQEKYNIEIQHCLNEITKRN